MYLLLSLIFALFFPEVGGDIANSVNSGLGSHITGLTMWIIGLVIAIIAD
jgi:hypothetical protein